MTTARLAVAGIVLGLVALILTARTAAQDSDPPSRVARLNFSEGSVSFQPGGEGDWLTAVHNRPLTTGDNLWTDRGSRAELHVGSTALRMGPETSLSFLDLNDRDTQLRLAQGSVLLRVHHIDDEDAFEIDTPNLAFTVLRPGEYRIDVNDAGDETVVTNWRGQGEVTGGGYSYTVVAGQRARFSGIDQLSHQIDQLDSDDDFDRWAFDRDRREDRLDTENYISPEMTGFEDLDDYGRWQYVGQFGNVWFPNAVAEGWAPYRYGHWAWIAPWGWTWVEDEPWGFAPFHYGRWAYVPGGWCWVPGPVVVRPVYAPALVAFVGGGSFALVSGPSVGWFPLGPGEVWVPPYRVSRTYVNNVNITNTNVNVTRVTNVYNRSITNDNTTVNKITYVNQHVTNAVTVVPRDTFVNARPVARSVVAVNPKQIAEASVTHQMPVQPVRASALGAGAPARAKPPASVANRQVIARKAPAPPPPSFEQRIATREAPNVRVNGPGAPAQDARNAPRPSAAPRSEEVRSATTPTEPRNANLPAQAETNVTRPSQGDRPYQSNPRPEAGNRPPDNREIPRSAESNRSLELGSRPVQPFRQPEPSAVSRPPHATEAPSSESWSHPLARPAPPVQQHNPQQAQQEEQKFRNWQDQRQQAQRQQAQPTPRR